MPKTKATSPARSQGGITTPKRKTTRGSRSLCSPALSTASGRLTSLIDQFKDKNMESFALSPLNGRSVLNDNTEIEEPRRKSWWKKLDENSQDVIQVLEDNKLTVNNTIEEFINIEILSQEKKTYTMDLPESSDSESINSIVLPQRRLFTQKENQPQKKFGHLIDNRESLAKLHKTNNTNIDKTINIGTRELFQNAKRSKPIFPAALLNISSNKTAADKTRENALADPKPQVRSIFGNRPANKRKNMFADFIVSESEDEIPDIQPKVFGFQKKLEQRRISSVSRDREASPTSSITTDIELDFRMMLPSSTMVENQLEDMVASTPIKRAKLSKLSEAKESEAGTLQRNTISHKTKHSNKSVSSTNKSKTSPAVNKSLNNSRTTRSMLKNASKLEENVNTTLKQGEKSNISKTSSKDIISSSKSYTDKRNATVNKSQNQNNSKIRNSPKAKEIEIECEENEANAVNAIKNVTLLKNKSTNRSLRNTTANKSINEKERKITQVHDIVDKTGSNELIDAIEQEEDENNFTLKYDNDEEIIDEVDVNPKNNKTVALENVEQETEINKTKNKSCLSNKSAQKLHKASKTVEESVESQTEHYSADDNVDGDNQYKETSTLKNRKIDEATNNSVRDMTAEMVQENGEEVHESQENEDENYHQKNVKNISNDQNKSQELANQSQEIENVENESNEGDENDNQNEMEEEANNDSQEVENESKEDEDQGNESQKVQDDKDESQEVLNESQVVTNNEFASDDENNQSNIEANVNKSQEVADKSREEEYEDLANENQEVADESLENEDEDLANESQEVADESLEKEDEDLANESQEVANESQEEEDEDLANESQEVANESQDHEDQDLANESQEVADESLEEEDEDLANESQEVANESQEDEDLAHESQEVADENQEEEDEDLADERQEVEAEVNESQEIDGEANESQEIEDDVNESQDLDEQAHKSQTVEDDEAVEQGDDEAMEQDEEVTANESEVNDASANGSQEVENNEEESDVESEAEIDESEEVEDDQQMDESDEADKAIASDPEISDQDDNQTDGMEIDDEHESESSNAEESEQNEHVSHEERQIEIEPSEEIEESPNVTHDTTGRHRKKNLNKSPEVMILQDKTNQIDSFIAKSRNTSVRKTKSMIKNLNIRPSLAPHRDSTGFSDGTRNSSAEGSGWDSHRTTRKTLRQTFGKDFTPRKSLRAWVMEKSAKRQTEHMEMHSETTKFPLANSTEMPEDSNLHVEDIVESDHELSRRTRQTTLEQYLQKIKEQNIEKKLKMEAAVRNSLKTPVTNSFCLFKVPNKPAPRRPKPAQSKPKKQINSIIPFDELPAEVIEDMKYKPPKRFQPTNASWITKRLYKFLETKLEPKYDYKARVRAEKLVETIYFFTKDLRRHDLAPIDAVDVLKHELARLDIVRTHFEFYEFFHQFMPREVRVKVVPDLVNKIAVPRHGVFSDILRGNGVHG